MLQGNIYFIQVIACNKWQLSVSLYSLSIHVYNLHKEQIKL